MRIGPAKRKWGDREGGSGHWRGYVMSTKVIFRRAEVFVLAEVCLPRRPHAVFPSSQVLSERENTGARGRLMNIYFLSNIRPKLAWMRTSRKTDFRWNKQFRSSKNNFRGHDISQGLDREPPSLSPHFLLVLHITYFISGSFFAKS